VSFRRQISLVILGLKSRSYDAQRPYRRPPKNRQFERGVSGNPSGRPKRTSDLGSELLREAHAPLIINENGKRKVISKYQAFAKQLFNRALSGSTPAMRLLVALLQPALEKAAEEEQQSFPELLRRLTNAQLAYIATRGGKLKLPDGSGS
jgi:hypothetical protein